MNLNCIFCHYTETIGVVTTFWILFAGGATLLYQHITCIIQDWVIPTPSSQSALIICCLVTVSAYILSEMEHSPAYQNSEFQIFAIITIISSSLTLQEHESNEFKI
jgi:glycerol-3-phosphate acyltransferase PlsY